MMPIVFDMCMSAGDDIMDASRLSSGLDERDVMGRGGGEAVMPPDQVGHDNMDSIATSCTSFSDLLKGRNFIQSLSGLSHFVVIAIAFCLRKECRRTTESDLIGISEKTTRHFSFPQKVIDDFFYRFCKCQYVKALFTVLFYILSCVAAFGERSKMLNTDWSYAFMYVSKRFYYLIHTNACNELTIMVSSCTAFYWCHHVNMYTV